VSKTSKACRVDLLENIIVTSISEWLLSVWILYLILTCIQSHYTATLVVAV